MIKVTLFKIVFFILSCNLAIAQTIKCRFPALFNKWVKLGTFEGLQSKITDSVLVNEKGTFTFNFSLKNPAIGYLITAENKPYFLILDKEEKISLQGENFTMPESISVLSGKQNQDFNKYASEHPKREQVLSAWGYLDRIYNFDSLFMNDKESKKFITKQYTKIKEEDQSFLDRLDSKSYVAWYLPLRRLVSEVSIITQARPEEISKTIHEFRNLDYTDERLYRSGLLKDAIDSHFWLIENSGKSLDSVFIEMQISIDTMMIKLIKNEKKLNEITNYLFDLLERHSLFQASEYLALKVLIELNCTVDKNLSKQLETYRAMKIGNIAPDFYFYANTTFPIDIIKEETKKLSDLKLNHTLMVFGASTCPKCTEEIPQISSLYKKWKEQGVEVVFISLDENEADYKKFIRNLPFIHSCDFKKWESPIAQSYYVFGTPTMFLLDSKRKIILRPNSAKQVDSWIDWFLLQKNKY